MQITANTTITQRPNPDNGFKEQESGGSVVKSL